MRLRIHLLGQPRVIRDGNSVDLPGHRPLALLAYLILSKKPYRREHLMDLLFDGPNDPQAALRWTLSKLRKAIGSEYILADRQNISFNFQSEYWLDVFEFEAGETELYKGDLLEGLYLRDALRYEDWLLFERQRLREKYQAGLEHQLEMHKNQNEYAAVIITAQQLLKLDDLREDWFYDLIHAYARLGKRATALEVFEKCRQSLRKQWGTDPSPETEALVAAIRSGQFEVLEPQIEGEIRQSKAANITEARATEPAGSTQIRPRPRLPQILVARIAMIFLAAMILILGLSRVLNVNTQTSMYDGGTLSNGEKAGQSESTPQKFVGTTVWIYAPFGDEYAGLFQQSMAPFEETSGIDIKLVTGEYEIDLATKLETGNLPDIVTFPQPGWLAKLAEQGKIIDIKTFLDDDYLHRQYPETFIELATVDGQILGVWYTVDVKSLVWYPKQAFDAKGYKVPDTWDELIALSDQIVADGGVPWCIGIESADFSGWVGTDWVEDILLRTAPPETYDAWVNHDLPFNSPEIRRVFEIMGHIWLNDKYIFGGTANISLESFADSPGHLFEDPPGCYLHKQASFAPFLFPKGVTHGQDYDFFYLPPIDPKFGHPVLGSGNIFVMVTDRPEVREVIRFLTTAESTKALIKNGGYLSPHKDTPIEWFPTPVELRFAQIVLGADAYRFDGSDMMPDQVGLRAFYRGITDWLEGADLETVLQEIDNSWPE